MQATNRCLTFYFRVFEEKGKFKTHNVNFNIISTGRSKNEALAQCMKKVYQQIEQIEQEEGSEDEDGLIL